MPRNRNESTPDEAVGGDSAAAAEANAPRASVSEAVSITGDVDRVVMASRAPDGTPAQTADFQYIGDKETAVEAAKVQLGEQRVSAADTALRGATTEPATGNAEGSSEPDPYVAPLVEATQKAQAKAEKDAEAEVNAHFKG